MQYEIEQISAEFTSTWSSKVTLKIIFWDRNKSFKVFRMSIEDDYLVPIKNLPPFCTTCRQVFHPWFLPD